MTIDYNFKFRIGLSPDIYTNKEEATKCTYLDGAKEVGKKKMRFIDTTLTGSEMLMYLTGGHSYCGIFNPPSYLDVQYGNVVKKISTRYKKDNGLKLTYKKDDYFEGSHIITVDIDKTKFNDVNSYIEKLTYKPSLVYMSYSDNKDKGGEISRRFHLLYIFDSLLNKESWYILAYSLHKHVALDTDEPIEDYCGCRCSQYFNGVYGNPESYNTGIIYNLNDIQVSADTVEEVKERLTKENAEPEYDEYLLWAIKNLEFSEVSHKLGWKYKVFYRNEKFESLDGKFSVIDPDNYIRLHYYPSLLKDGQHRRRTLKHRMGLRRLIMPEINHSHLLYCAYVDANTICDNSDGVIDLKGLKERVNNIMKMSESELREYLSKDLERIKFTIVKGTDKHRPQKLTFDPLCTPAYRQEVRKAYDYYQIWPVWIFGQSVDKNMEREEIKRLGFSRRKYYRFLNDVAPLLKSGDTYENVYVFISEYMLKRIYIYSTNKCTSDTLQPKNRMDEIDKEDYHMRSKNERAKRQAKRDAKEANLQIFWDNYDPKMTWRDNLANLKGLGMKISKSKLYELIKEYNNIEKSEPKIEEEITQIPENDYPNSGIEGIQNVENDYPNSGIEGIQNAENITQKTENSESRFGNFNMDFNLPEFNWDLNYESKR